MLEENESKKKISGGSFGDVSGQVAIGENIKQFQHIEQADLKELIMNLYDFQKGIDNLGLSSEDQNIVNGNISAAIKETKKDKPVQSRIKEEIEKAINTVKEAGKTISNISEVYEPAKKIAKLLGISFSVLL